MIIKIRVRLNSYNYLPKRLACLCVIMMRLERNLETKWEKPSYLTIRANKWFDLLYEKKLKKK